MKQLLFFTILLVFLFLSACQSGNMTPAQIKAKQTVWEYANQINQPDEAVEVEIQDEYGNLMDIVYFPAGVDLRNYAMSYREKNSTERIFLPGNDQYELKAEKGYIQISDRIATASGNYIELWRLDRREE